MSSEKIGEFNPIKKIENYSTQEQSLNIDEVFKDNPEIATIFNNNKELFQEYLNSIFPNSKVKDIVWHGSPDKNIEKFLFPQDDLYIKHENTTTGVAGVYFADKKSEAERYSKWNEGEEGKAYSVLLNLEKIITVGETSLDGISETGLSKSSLWNIQPGMIDAFKNADIDALVAGEYMIKTEGFKEMVVLNTNKIYIIGSQGDILKAKEWIKNKQL